MKLPGTRRRLRRAPVAILSGSLITVATLLLVHDVLVRFNSVDDVLSFRQEWVGVAAAASLLFVSLTFHAARRQWASELYPYISWTRGKTTESRLGLEVAPGERLWSVDASNLGGGLAIIDHVTYDIALRDRPQTSRSGVGYDEMLAVLESTGFRDEIDFVAADWQHGFALKDELERVWEFPLELATQIQTLDAQVYYRSRIGDVYVLTLSCVPARGIPPAPTSRPKPRRRAPAPVTEA